MRPNLGWGVLVLVLAGCTSPRVHPARELPPDLDGRFVLRLHLSDPAPNLPEWLEVHLSTRLDHRTLLGALIAPLSAVAVTGTLEGPTLTLTLEPVRWQYRLEATLLMGSTEPGRLVVRQGWARWEGTCDLERLPGGL